MSNITFSQSQVIVKNDGKVGIGTIDPIRQLEVSGDNLQVLRIGSDNLFPSMIELTRGGTSSGSDWRWTNNGDLLLEYSLDNFSLTTTKIMHIEESNQHIAFGNSPSLFPMAKVDIEDPSWQLRLRNDLPGGNDWWIGASADSWNIGRNKFAISRNNFSSNAAFVIDSSNNIGIGTRYPVTRLHVLGGSDAEATVSNTGSLIVGSATSAHIAIDGNEIMAKSKADSVGTLFLQNNGGNTRIKGNVGIGTDPAPSTVLTLEGNARFFDASLLYGAIYPDQGNLVINSKFGFLGAGNGHLILQANTGVPFATAGFTGIGTTHPVTKLHVVGQGDASYTSHGLFVSGDTSSTNIVIDDNEILSRNNSNASPLFIQRDGGDLLLCGNENGQVGIGVAGVGGLPPDPSYLLSVDGKIISEELRIENSGAWPDYVFEENYTLKSIYEVEQAIKAKKHLPGIPSATEIENNGQMIGDLQRRMMEKIEELTLYTIEQQKQIDEQKEEIKLLIQLVSKRSNQ